MKKYFTAILLVFLTKFGYAQFGATKFEEAEIIFKDGSVLNGFSRAFTYDLQFKDSNKKHLRRINFMDIQSVKFTIYDDKKKNIKHDLVVECLRLEGKADDKKNYVLAELIVKNDRVKIFGVYFPAGGGFSMGSGLGAQVSVVNLKGNFNASSYSDYYCYLNNEATPRLMYKYTSLKTFRIMASECFKDCVVLSEKINKKEFAKENVFEIANFYNDKCK
jgi:hypothetical protein